MYHQAMLLKVDRHDGPLYHARGLVRGKTIPGRVGVRSEDDHRFVHACIPYGLRNYRINSFEVLTVDDQSKVSYERCKRGDPLPGNAIEGGFGGGPKYYARREKRGKRIPGRVGAQGTHPTLYLKKACIPYGLRKRYIKHFEVLVDVADKISHVEFHLDKGKILDTKPKVLAVQEICNESSLPQSKEYSFSESVSNTSTFTHQWGLSISAGVAFGCSLPCIAEGKISVNASASVSLTWGKSETFQKTHSGKYPVQAGPYTKIECKVVANEAKLEVPYTKHSISGKTSGGTWSGVSTWDVKTSFKETKLDRDQDEKTKIWDNISHVEFHLDKGTILDTNSKVLAVQEICNESSLPQLKEYSFSETVSITSTFTHQWGSSISAGVTFGCSLPCIAEGKICVNASPSVSLTRGKSETFQKTHSEKYPVQAGPCTKVECKVVANEGKLEVPYTIHFKSGKTSGGMWNGVSTWDVKTSFKVIKLERDQDEKKKISLSPQVVIAEASTFHEKSVMNKKKDVNILILGEIGVGKSTWINGIANYAKHNTLRDAMDDPEFTVVIPSRFLACFKNGINFMDEEVDLYSRSWVKSCETTCKLLQLVTTMQPHETKETISLNKARSCIIAMSKPMGQAVELIEKNVRRPVQEG